MSNHDFRFAQLYQVTTHVLYMLRDRGFLVSPEFYSLIEGLKDYSGSEEDWRTFRDELTIQFRFFTNGDHTRRAIVTFYRKPGKVSKGELSAYQALLEQENKVAPITDGVFISEDPVGALAKSTADIISNTYHVQFFTDENFSYYPVGHRFTPRHVGLTDEEKKIILQEQKISFNKMPQLLANDAIVRWYHWPVGTLVRITRENETSQYYEYRAVVNALL